MIDIEYCIFIVQQLECYIFTVQQLFHHKANNINFIITYNATKLLISCCIS